MNAIDIITEDIAQFCIDNSKGIYTQSALYDLCKAISMHIEYNTILVMKDSGGIAVMCRWNISEDGLTAVIIDFVIRKEYRERKIIKSILLYGLSMFPNVKVLAYDKYKDGKIVRKGLHSVDRFLRRRF